MPSTWLILHFRSGYGRRCRRLWLPLFLAYPLLMLAALAVLPAAAVAAVAPAWRPYALLLLVGPPRLAAVLCAARGLRVDVVATEALVHLEFF